jgi:hypothetical protein
MPAKARAGREVLIDADIMRLQLEGGGYLNKGATQIAAEIIRVQGFAHPTTSA